MIAVYGLKFIFISIFLAVVCALWGAWKDSLVLFIIALAFAVLAIFLVYFYRNPSRTVPNGNDLILSIADGRVLSVEEIENDYIGGRGKKVSIFLSVLDPHINRVPTDGTVDYVRYNPGKFFQAFREKASDQNEQTEIGLDYGSGKIIFKQIVGILARRIVCNLNKGQQVSKGEIFGMIHFGSRAEIFLPENIEITVKPGQKVKAGTSVIGRFKDD